MGTFKTFDNIQSDGDTRTEDERLEEFFAYIRRKSREFDLAFGAEHQEFRQSHHRREQSIQRPSDQAFQSSEEALKKLQTSYYPYWYAHSTGSSGFMGTSWHLGSGATLGNKPDKVQGQVHATGSNEPPDTSYIQLED